MLSPRRSQYGKQAQGKGKILADRRHGIKKFAGITDEKTECRGKDDKIAEGCSADETEGGDQAEREEELFFMLIEARCDKTPDLVKDNRACQQNTGNQSELQIKKNPSW